MEDPIAKLRIFRSRFIEKLHGPIFEFRRLLISSSAFRITLIFPSQLNIMPTCSPVTSLKFSTIVKRDILALPLVSLGISVCCV